MTVGFGSSNVCPPATFVTYFFYNKDTWIVLTDYKIYFYLTVLFLLVVVLQLPDQLLSKV